jgi:hypothetical protein
MDWDDEDVAVSVMRGSSSAAAVAIEGLNFPTNATAGIASVWYMNESPTPLDITDKSSAGHTPAWANANRPALYTA